jgi:hypothetical protein
MITAKFAKHGSARPTSRTKHGTNPSVRVNAGRNVRFSQSKNVRTVAVADSLIGRTVSHRQRSEWRKFERNLECRLLTVGCLRAGWHEAQFLGHELDTWVQRARAVTFLPRAKNTSGLVEANTCMARAMAPVQPVW